MADRTEISFEVDPVETRVLDGYCYAKNLKRTQVMRKILKEWSEDKHREAMMVCRVAGNKPEVAGMTKNAFTIPATGIAIRQQSNKQIKQNATRVNRQEPSCAKNDMHKTHRIKKAGI